MADRSAILWQNSTATVTLIDLPQSIASAQGSVKAPFPYRLLSTTPLLHPFDNIESKSARSKADVECSEEPRNPDDAIHRQYQTVLKHALHEIQSQYHGSWCLPRHFVEDVSCSRKRRRLSSDVGETSSTAPPTLPSDLLPGLAREDQSVTLTVEASGPDQADDESLLTVKDLRFFASYTLATSLQIITPSPNPDTYTFYIPANSSFSLGDCYTDSFSFRKTLQTRSRTKPTQQNDWKFDFILLDPPWPNRSVRRTHKTPGSTYSTIQTTSDIREMLLDMNVDLLMSDNCLVGIWITNKAAIRDVVLGDSGLFDCWNVALMEEWLWLKTTISGEPVLPCEGVRRKPYEVLLLGRRRESEAAPTEEQRPQHRVIFAVPDLHSRKPCLKSLIEPLMPNTTHYRALEIFARYLVAGWCSWGDECIKFNWDGNWQKAASIAPLQ